MTQVEATYYDKNYVPSLKRLTLEKTAAALDACGYRLDPGNFIFVMSWMRSGSSLLSNLLISNPDVFGMGESHVRYRGRTSLIEAALVGARTLRRFPRRDGIYFDKILHNHLDRDMGREICENARFIFLIREPEESARSIRSMWQKIPPRRVAEPHQYLLERMEHLVEMADRVPRQKKYLITYDDIINDTPAFAGLPDFVGFPVSREYKVQSFVGKKGVGDFSDNIKSGKILAQEKKPSRPEDNLLTEAQNARLTDLYAEIARRVAG